MGDSNRDRGIKAAVIRSLSTLPGARVESGKSSFQGDPKAKPLSPTKWVSDSDMDWAEEVGIFVQVKRKRDSSRKGEFALAPKIVKCIVNGLPVGQTNTAMDIAIVILDSIRTAMPHFGPEDLVKAFRVISNSDYFQDYPLWKRPLQRKE